MSKNTRSAGKGLNPQYSSKDYSENFDGIKFYPLCRRHGKRLDANGCCPECWDSALNKKEEWSVEE